MLHIARATPKSLSLHKKILEDFSGKKSEHWASTHKKRQDRKSNRTRQKHKRGDSKVESNNSPETPDRGENIRHPPPPFREKKKREALQQPPRLT